MPDYSAPTSYNAASGDASRELAERVRQLRGLLHLSAAALAVDAEQLRGQLLARGASLAREDTLWDGASPPRVWLRSHGVLLASDPNAVLEHEKPPLTPPEPPRSVPLVAGDGWVAVASRSIGVSVGRLERDGWRYVDVRGAVEMQVTCLAALDGELAAGGADGRVLWGRPDDGDVEQVLPPGHSPVTAVDLSGSAGQSVLLALRGDGVLSVHELPKGRLIHQEQFEPWPRPVVATAARASKYFTASIRGGIVEWDVLTGAQLRLRPAGAGVHALAVSADATRVAVATGDGIRTWVEPDATTSPTSPTSMRTGRGRITSLALTDDGSRLASTSTTGELRVWDTAAGATLCRFTLDRPAPNCAIAGDGSRLFAVDEEGSVYAFDVVESLPPVSAA